MTTAPGKFSARYLLSVDFPEPDGPEIPMICGLCFVFIIMLMITFIPSANAEMFSFYRTVTCYLLSKQNN